MKERKNYESPDLEITPIDESEVVTMSFDPNDDSCWSSGWI